LVELRDANDPSLIIATQSALIQRDGDVVMTDGISPLSFQGIANSAAYVAIRHRNHFGIRTLDTFATDIDIVINFSDLSFPVFGFDSMIEVENVKTLISGDANKDGQINAVDKNNFWRVENGEPFDYINSKADFNLDGAVNPVDKNGYWRVNNSKVEQLD